MRKKIHNIRYALNGISIAWREEFSFKVQIVAAVAVFFLAWWFEVTKMEFLMLVFAVALVLSAEALNTALEEFCDMVKNDPDPHIGKIKDLGAAAVLIASFAALIIGAAIFIPYLS